MNYKSAHETCIYFHITPMTLFNWKKNGKIKYKQFSSKKFLYDIDSVENNINSKERKNVIYARVSTTKQKKDLEKQIDLLKTFMISNGYIVSDIFSDIASGMNDNRKGLNELLDEIISNDINTVFITYKDRLTRFGFNYFSNLFQRYNTKIIVINQDSDISFEDELTEDLISIIHHFSMKMRSNRRKILKDAEENLIKVKK